MKSIKVAILLTIVCAQNLAFGQSNNVDSLLKVLNVQKEDTSQVNTLNLLSEAFFNKSEFEKGIIYSEKALKLSQNLDFRKGVAESYFNKGSILSNQSNYREAFKYFELALADFSKINFKKGIADSYNKIGIMYEYFGNYPETLKVYYKALKIYESLHNMNKVAGMYNNIGIIYQLQKKYNEAIINLNLAKNIFIKSGHPNLNHPYNNLGSIYLDQGKCKEAFENFEKSYNIRIKMGDKFEIANILSSMASAHRCKGDYNLSEKKFYEAFVLSKEIGYEDGITQYFINLGDLNFQRKNYSTAESSYAKALILANKAKRITDLQAVFEGKALLDSATGNYKSALENYKKYIIYRDSLINRQNSDQLIQQKMQYEFDKKEEANNESQAIRDLETQSEIKNQKSIRNLIAASLAGLMVFSLILYRNYQAKQKVNSNLENTLNTLKSTQNDLIESEKRASLVKERLRMSQGLHDDLGSNLSGIKLYSHLAQSQNIALKTDEVNNSLVKIQNTAQDIIDNLKDIVWSVNPEEDNLGSLFGKIKEYAQNLCGSKNIKLASKIQNGLLNNKLNFETRQHLYLFSKEAINNAVKYSDSSEIDYSIKSIENLIQISIIDNGIGFNFETVKKGNGLINLQKRANELKGKLLINSKIGEGTRISLQFSYS